MQNLLIKKNMLTYTLQWLCSLVDTRPFSVGT